MDDPEVQEMFEKDMANLRQAFRDEIKQEIEEMNADSQDETVDLNESEMEDLINQVEAKYFWNEDEAEEWME